MRIFPFSLLAGLAALLLVPAAEAGKCQDLFSRKEPRLQAAALIPGPAGPVAIRRSDYAYCRDNSSVHRYGVATADGSELVPPDFTHAVMIGPRHALVRLPLKKHAKEPGPWQYYEVGKGITGPAPDFYEVSYLPRDSITYARSATAVSVPFGRVATEIAPQYAWMRFDYYLFPDGKSAARKIPGIGGPGVSNYTPMLHHGNALYAHFAAPDGRVLSQLFDLKGEPISPVVNRVEVWRTASFRGDYSSQGSDETALGDELFTLMPLPPHPELPADLYLPLLPDGSPRPLPPGVVGVFPLRAGGIAKSVMHGDRVTYGWSVVLDTPKGLRFVVGNGLIADVLELAGRQTPVAGVRHLAITQPGRHPADHILIKSAEDGLWRALTMQLQRPYVTEPDKGYATAQLAYDGTRRAESERRAGEEERMKEESRRLARLDYELDEKKYRELLAKGDYCKNDPKIIADLHGPAINHMLRDCQSTDYMLLNKAVFNGADPALVQSVIDKREQARRMEEYEKMERSRRSLEAAERDFQARVRARAWANDTFGGAGSAHDSFMKSSKDTYMRNLDAWNRGAQNWGGPSD